MLDAKKRNISSCYDAAARAYVDKFMDELDHKPIDRLLLSYFHEQTQGRGQVCDIGCGPGEIAVYLHKLGADAKGIDLSPQMISEARRLNPDIDFSVGDMFNLDLRVGCLAGITAFYAIVNFDEEDLPLIFQEFYRVLQPRGLLFLTFHIGNEKVVAENFLDQNVTLGFTLFDPDRVLELLKAQGFRIANALIRYPYDEKVESQTRRAYIFAEKEALDS